MKLRLITILLFCLAFVTYITTAPKGDTPYNYFVLLADSFLNGKYYLSQQEPWLNELIPIVDGKYAVVYPPAPSILLMPIIYLFGTSFPQEYLAHLLGALFTVIIFKITFLKTGSYAKSIFFYFLAAFGNIIWYLSSNGSVWYLGQVSGVFFLTAAIFESLTKKRFLLISTFMAMAILSRLQLVLALPFIIYLLKDNLNKKSFIFISIPLTFFGSLFLYYNYLRFGDFFETGYSKIPGVLEEPWYSKGIFHPSYIPNSLKVMFLSLPIFSSEPPYVKPSWGGLSILITTPFFIYLLSIKMFKKENIILILSILALSFVSLSHGGTGFTQFGYRYAVDFYPLLFMLLINNFKDKNLKFVHYLLLIISIIVNTWGVLFINKFGWVSF